MSKGPIDYDNDNKIPTATTPHGGCYVSTPAATTVTVAGTFYVLAGTTTALDLDLFTHSSPGRITYTGTTTRTFFVTASASVVSSANNILISTRIAKNGTTIAASEMQFYKTTAADTKIVSSQTIVSLAQNDYLEMYITCDSAGATVTANTGTLIANEN